jgi:cell wall-associated NlpC family hydrolase
MFDEQMKKIQYMNGLWNQNQPQPSQVQSNLLQNQPQPSQVQQQTYAQASQMHPLMQMEAYQSRLQTLASPEQPQAQATNPAMGGNGAGLKAIAAGQKYIGNSKYVWGAGRKQSDIENGKFDCSGFVNYAFKSAGIDLGSGNTDTIASKGKAVNPNNLQPGDIVFFDTYKQNGHVGIYLGNGKFIGSQTKNGVSVEDMTSGYWQKHFSGNARRV